MIEQDFPVSFLPGSDASVLIEAAEEYADIWRVDGARIISTLEQRSGLRFREKQINAVIHGGSMSFSDPLILSFVYPPEIKRGALVHELAHRIIDANGYREYGETDRVFEEHKIVDLLLYDTWVELYGEDFARKNVEYENQLMRENDQSPYERAWNWALGMTREQRAREFRKYFEFGPPAEWFTGVGKIATGISVVMPDPRKILPGDEAGQREFARHWSKFTNYTGNPVTSSDTDERRQRAERALAEAEIVITELTGFSPVAIMNQATHLHELYRGKEETAPFEILLFE